MNHVQVGDVYDIDPSDYNCGNFNSRRESGATSVRITKVDNVGTKEQFPFFEILDVNGTVLSTCCGCFDWNEMKPRSKNAKALPVKLYKFALHFEFKGYSTEYFYTLPQVKARLKDLASHSQLRRDSIYVHTLSKTQKVELGTSITLRKHA